MPACRPELRYAGLEGRPLGPTRWSRGAVRCSSPGASPACRPRPRRCPAGSGHARPRPPRRPGRPAGPAVPPTGWSRLAFGHTHPVLRGPPTGATSRRGHLTTAGPATPGAVACYPTFEEALRRRLRRGAAAGRGAGQLRAGCYLVLWGPRPDPAATAARPPRRLGIPVPLPVHLRPGPSSSRSDGLPATAPIPAARRSWTPTGYRARHRRGRRRRRPAFVRTPTVTYADQSVPARQASANGYWRAWPRHRVSCPVGVA